MNPLPRNVTVAANGFNIWNVTVVLEGSRPFFAQGWKGFSQECGVARHDILVFNFDLESHFSVKVFNRHGNLKGPWPFDPVNVVYRFPQRITELFYVTPPDEVFHVDCSFEVPALGLSGKSNEDYLVVEHGKCVLLGCI